MSPTNENSVVIINRLSSHSSTFFSREPETIPSSHNPNQEVLDESEHPFTSSKNLGNRDDVNGKLEGG
jgi:hypothetical protein